MGGRMNLPMLLGLILSAVMVTGHRIKDHIASDRNIQADAAAADPENAKEAIVQAANATKNIQADEVAEEAADEDAAEPEADKNGCETYAENACADGVAYGCLKEGRNAGFCWSSCTTKLGYVGFQWLRVPASGVIIKSRSLKCDPTKPGDDLDLQCVGKADLSHSWLCHSNRLFGQLTENN